MGTIRTVFVASDLDRSIAFYRAGAGLEIVDEWDRPEDRGVVLSGGAGMLELFAASQRHHPTVISGVRLGVEVDDVERCLETLRSAGFPVEAEVQTMPWGHVQAVVQDPDGLGVTLYAAVAAGG